MATLAAESTQPARVRTGGRFYFHLSLACLAIGVLGFTPTFWLAMALGRFNATPLVHLHGLVFTAWLLLLVGQNWRISQGRLDHHRAWGLVGIALATMMFMIGWATAIASLGERLAAGQGDAGREFLIVPLTSVTLFYVFFIAAIANLRRPEWHRRLIFVATSVILVPAVARVFLLTRVGLDAAMDGGMRPPPPAFAPLLSVAACSLIVVAGMAYDWRTRGKVHAAWTIGLVATLAAALGRLPVAQTAAWHAFADWTTRIA